LKKTLITLPRNLKRLLLISIDILSLWLALWLALMIRADEFFLPAHGYQLTQAQPSQLFDAFILTSFITIPILIFSRLYRSITRYMTLETYVKIAKACIASGVIWSLAIYLLNYPIPRTVSIIYILLSTTFVFVTRFSARTLLLPKLLGQRKNILIFGDINSASKIAELLKNDLQSNPVGFISDNSEFKRTRIGELPVYLQKDIDKIIYKKNIQEIIIMLPKKSRSLLRKAIHDFEKYPVKLVKLPDISQLTQGNISLDDLKKIDIEDLLGRDAVEPDPYLLKSCIENKTVLITGCGGSIGSELARQIIKLNPKKLVLIEQSEFFLYEIDQSLSDYKLKHKCLVPIKSYLGSVSNTDFITNIFKNENINTVYHAAAHKHVPLVEHNPISAIQTNILGTFIAADAAYKNNVEDFVLISSDKAVRPTNVMGATKRFAELILQSLQDVVNNLPSNKCNTKFSMVRFGNVLDTSGSVIPLFRKQIEAGGPVTVTDPKVIRYFMTITEATELVIQAGSLSKGGDVFLLEMGEPIYVLDLAKEMIRLSGNQIKNSENPSGNIEIVFTGLRAGEKLFEELLIGETVDKTMHTHIMRANEEKLSYEKITYFLEQFKSLDSQSSIKTIQNVLYEAVDGYKPYKNSNVVKINK
jgi:FlaA1/EpsC-like NDP-sugar epimerase